MVGIYTRLSKLDLDSNSIANQLREGKEFVKNNNFKNVKHYNEGEGISGGSDIEDRPALQSLIDDIYSGLINIIWFRHQDRLERNTATFLLFTDAVKENNIKVFIGSNNQSVDYNDPNSFFQGGLMSMFNSYLIQKQSYLTKNAIKKNFELNYTHGIPPYGYKKESRENPVMVIDDNEADVVRDIFKMSLDGLGFRRIAQELNKKGVPTRYNKIGKGKMKTNTIWVDGTIQGIINNEIYKGIRKAKDGTIYNVQPIFEAYYYDKVVNHLKENMNNGGKKTVHQYLLNGICKCGKCGKSFNGRVIQSKIKTDRYYMCVTKRKGKHNCGNLSVKLNELENQIWNVYFKNKHIQSLINSEYDVMKDASKMNEAGNQISILKKEKQEQIDKKKNLVVAVASGSLKQKDIREVLDDIESKIYDIDSAIDEQKQIGDKYKTILENHIIRKEELEDFDNVESFDDKQLLIKKYIKEITVTKLGKQHIKIYVHFYSQNMESDILVIDRLYKWVYEPNRMNLIDMNGNSFDPKTDVKMIKEIDAMFNHYEDLYIE